MYLSLTTIVAFSVNYFINEDELTIDDPNATLKIYDDKKSVSGNAAKRHFCSICGSPVFTKTPRVPGKVFLKAALFDSVSPPATEVFIRKQYDNDLDPRETHELQEIQTHELDYSTPSVSSGDEYRIVTRRTISRTRHRQTRKGNWGKLIQFWTHNVTLTVPQKSSRDYFALERTFLAYIRTSLVITQQGVLIAQLFRLQAAEVVADRLGFRKVGTPLSVACYCVGILVALVGAYRFWRQQNAIARGKIYAGGWELNSVGILLGCITLTVLIVSTAIMVEIDMGLLFVRRGELY
ncbi:hypothetical protein N7445_010525 [Penicillium cf. griseofulvum]|nr:hypothetical protein N7445_010525 [Penicillium cf. griseofulvum]